MWLVFQFSVVYVYLRNRLPSQLRSDSLFMSKGSSEGTKATFSRLSV